MDTFDLRLNIDKKTYTCQVEIIAKIFPADGSCS